MDNKERAYQYIDDLLNGLSNGGTTTLHAISNDVSSDIVGIVKSILFDNGLLDPQTYNLNTMLYISNEGVKAKERGIKLYMQDIQDSFDLSDSLQKETFNNLKFNKYFPIWGLAVAVIAIIAPIFYEGCFKANTTNVQLQSESIDSIIHPIERTLHQQKIALDSIVLLLRDKKDSFR